MCQTNACGCATADSSLPVAAVALALIGAAVSSAAAAITGALFAILLALSVLSAIGVTGLVYLLRRDRVRLWQPAAALGAAARPALPAPRPARAIAAPRLAIEAPATVPGTTAGLAGRLLNAGLPEEMMSAGT
jgi:hypothetical protein